MPRGGARPGAGRPRLSDDRDEDIFSPETYRALRSVRNSVRVPADAPDDHREIADEAFDTIVEVMRGRVHPFMATVRLKAASMVREEICGPVVRKIEVQSSLADLLLAAATPVFAEHDPLTEYEHPQLKAVNDENSDKK